MRDLSSLKRVHVSSVTHRNEEVERIRQIIFGYQSGDFGTWDTKTSFLNLLFRVEPQRTYFAQTSFFVTSTVLPSFEI